MNEEPRLEISPLSQSISSAGRSVNVEIYRLEGDTSWVLELEDEFNNSTVWDDKFESDAAALTQARQTILSDGIHSLIGPADGKGAWT